MRYTVSNTIHQPLEVVVEKFKDTEGAKKWMEGLHTIEPISGTPGEVGAVSKFHFTHKGKEMVIEETILEQNFPRQIKFAYHSQMGYNEVEMVFEAISENETRQINNSYFEMKGFMKIIGFIFKGMFKKQSMTYLEGFKKSAGREA